MLKAMKIFVVGAVIMFAYSQPAMAREFADIYSECGIGAMIAPRNEGVAAVTNVTWDSGTTAISSNITSPDSCSGGKEKTAAFIHQSYESLASDLSSGSGKYLDTLAVLTGRDAQAQEKLKVALRKDFAVLVAAPGYTDQSRFEKSKALYDLVYKNS